MTDSSGRLQLDALFSGNQEMADEYWEALVREL